MRSRIRLTVAARIVDARAAVTNAAMAMAESGHLRRAMLFARVAMILDRLRGYRGVWTAREWRQALASYAEVGR
ncbi:MAG TPA: hypothetical protein VF167_03595 [Longimicrobiaceae bacterium]